MTHEDAHASPSHAKQPWGRDHLNLAEFPISVLQRQQPVDEGGRKLDTAVFTASRYDPVSRRHVPQKVTLTTNSRAGLPTPADENVVLALLYVAKRGTDFRSDKVHFTPWQLFRIMRWSPNSRSYDRLRDVLRRLKYLTIVYENAWWDTEGRRYEEEFATGILATYKIVRQAGGRRGAGALPQSWVQWNPDFYESLAKGSLKRLDLDRLFGLRLPTSQRMYRFLDRHFYHNTYLQYDLREFACGHLGLSESHITPKLKEKLRPAIAELESIRFISPATPEERYEKVRPGVWRIRFRKGAGERRPEHNVPEQVPAAAKDTLREELTRRGVSVAIAKRLVAEHPELLVREKLEVLDWLTERRGARLLANPAGYLVASIRDRYAIPRDYEPRERREARWQEHRRRAEAFDRQRSAMNRRQHEQDAAVDNWLASRTEHERQAIEREALSGDDFLVKQYRQATSPAARERLGRVIVRQHAARLMGRSGGTASKT